MEGFSPDDALRWLEAGVADDALAEAYALVSDHVADLLWSLEARDPWAGEAIGRWSEVETAQRALVGDVAGKAALAGLFVDDADGRAVFAEFLGDALADTPRAAGNDSDFACEHAFCLRSPR